MNVSLTTELENYVSIQVESGLYNSASEVIREALRNQIKQAMSDQLKQRLFLSRQLVKSGEVILADSVYFENKREAVRQKHKETDK